MYTCSIYVRAMDLIFIDCRVWRACSSLSLCTSKCLVSNALSRDSPNFRIYPQLCLLFPGRTLRSKTRNFSVPGVLGKHNQTTAVSNQKWHTFSESLVRMRYVTGSGDALVDRLTDPTRFTPFPQKQSKLVRTVLSMEH